MSDTHGGGHADADQRGRKRAASSRSQSSDSRSDSSRSSTGSDDDRGHYKFDLGENLTPDYKIISVLGKGTFGEVLECWDRRRRTFVAVKVIRDIAKYRDAARIEIDVLEELRHSDPKCEHPLIRLERWFDMRGHVCMVFERLGLSVFDFLRRNDYRAFPMAHVVHISRQLLQALAFMHRRTIIHTDLKPENILFVHSDYVVENGTRRVRCPDVRLIDFGSATHEDHHHTSIVSTRHYRAPEVILGLGWSFPTDLWSVGCILIELYTGEALFQTHDDVEHLAMMEKVLGRIPHEMRAKASGAARHYFDKATLELQWPKQAHRPESTARYVNALRPLEEVAGRHPDLCDLLRQMLRYDPAARITAASALEHPFFKPVQAATTPAPPAAAAPVSVSVSASSASSASSGSASSAPSVNHTSHNSSAAPLSTLSSSSSSSTLAADGKSGR